MFNMIYWFVCRKLQTIHRLEGRWKRPILRKHLFLRVVKKVEADKAPQDVGSDYGGGGELSKRNWHRKQMRRSRKAAEKFKT